MVSRSSRLKTASVCSSASASPSSGRLIRARFSSSLPTTACRSCPGSTCLADSGEPTTQSPSSSSRRSATRRLMARPRDWGHRQCSTSRSTSMTSASRSLLELIRSCPASAATAATLCSLERGVLRRVAKRGGGASADDRESRDGKRHAHCSYIRRGEAHGPHREGTATQAELTSARVEEADRMPRVPRKGPAMTPGLSGAHLTGACGILCRLHASSIERWP